MKEQSIEQSTGQSTEQSTEQSIVQPSVQPSVQSSVQSNGTYIYGVGVVPILAVGACIFFAHNIKMEQKTR